MRHPTLIALAVAALCATVDATVLIPADLAELTRDAHVVVRGRVTATEPTWTDDWRSIETVVTLETESSLKGAAGRSIQFRVPGGQVGRYHRVFIGAPELSVGQRVVVFLGDRGSGTPYILGLSQGLFRVVAGPAGSLVTTPAILATGALPQPIVRGDPGRRAVALEDFERQVRALAGSAR
jgi:hypothetical protein